MQKFNDNRNKRKTLIKEEDSKYEELREDLISQKIPAKRIIYALGITMLVPFIILIVLIILLIIF